VKNKRKEKDWRDLRSLCVCGVLGDRTQLVRIFDRVQSTYARSLIHLRFCLVCGGRSSTGSCTRALRAQDSSPYSLNPNKLQPSSTQLNQTGMSPAYQVPPAQHAACLLEEQIRAGAVCLWLLTYIQNRPRTPTTTPSPRSHDPSTGPLLPSGALPRLHHR